jgi:hypothetical protein
MGLVDRRVEPQPVTGAERAVELRLGSLGGIELRPTRLFLWKGGEREGAERVVPLADRPVGLEHERTESTVRVGSLQVRSRGNPLMTIALAGAIAFKRWAEAPEEPARRDS